MTGHSLAIDGLSVRFGDRTVLDGVSFQAAAGEFVCVLGPNGAGKSTMLRAIAGLVPAKGRIVLDGADLASRPAMTRARLVAYLPQGHVAHWPLSVRDTVAIGRVPHGARTGRLSAGDLAIIERALAAVDATALAERPVTELSGGERARVMLARALAVEAPVLLADEAVAALDPGHQLTVMALLRDIASKGAIVLAALHDLTLAARFATRIVVLDHGRLAANGKASEAMAPELLARVFGIRAAYLEHDGLGVVVPWSTGAESRR